MLARRDDMSVDRYLQRIWYSRFSIGMLVLLPLSWLFGALMMVRKLAFQKGLLPSVRVRAPVIVVGNITVGGTGKTPFTLWLADQLTTRGWRIGIVLRGYGGHSKQWPRIVESNTSWQEVGDEACLIAARARAIVVVAPNRAQAAQTAVELGADLVISDDGLQHYRLQRDAEILVVDEKRGFGNRRLLPAGPLREPVGRSRDVDLRVLTRRHAGAHSAASPADPPTIIAESLLAAARHITSGEHKPLTDFRGSLVHAVAAIGHPEGFFEALRSQGLNIREHPYPDHAELSKRGHQLRGGHASTDDGEGCRKMRLVRRRQALVRASASRGERSRHRNRSRHT